MNTIFRNLISGHDFDSRREYYFSELAQSDVDYLYAYSLPCANPCLRIDFDNCKNLSRITLWESGECDIEVVSLKDSHRVLEETSELNSMGEFEDKLLSLVAYMQAPNKLH